MGLIDTLGLLFPRAMASYLMSRRLFDQARNYEAAKSSDFRRLVMNQTSGDGSMELVQDRLRQISRHLEDNHDLTVAIFDDLVNNTVGAGIAVAPMVRGVDGKLAEDVNDRLTDLWEQWAQDPESAGELAWPQLERQVARSVYRDGELFIQMLEQRAYAYPTKVQLALELLEADLVPFQYNVADRNILHGIQTNDWNRPVAFYVHRNHPGDPLKGASINPKDLKSVPARDMLHIKFSRRLRQRRGVPVLHAVINRLQDIKDYEESERIAARVAADFTWFIKRSAETSIAPGPAESGKARQLSMGAGMGFELQPGEDVGTIASERPNTALVNFREAMLRAVAGGTGTRFSSIARNYNGTYSAQRQELVEGAIAYRALFAHLVARLHRPVYAAFIRQVQASGALAGVRGKYDPSTLGRVDFRAPALPWIDPRSEATAWSKLVEAGLESRQEVMRQRGRDPGRVWDEIEEEQASGLFASAVEKAAPAAAEQPAPAQPKAEAA